MSKKNPGKSKNLHAYHRGEGRGKTWFGFLILFLNYHTLIM
jgi:hypothetical protein